MKLSRVGVDLAKNVYQLHGVCEVSVPSHRPTFGHWNRVCPIGGNEESFRARNLAD